MLPLLSNLTASILLSASVLINPTTPTKPKTLSFDASAYVTLNNQIRVAVEKNTDLPVVMILRNKSHEVFYRQNISKKEVKYAVKLDVGELANGEYELEIKSSEGSIRKQLNLSNQPVQQTSRLIAIQ